jgi:hypothetical protein
VVIRKHLSLLLIILLVITMTGQAASAYIMSCQGTASCCCIAPTADMGMNGAMPGGVNQGCCDTTSAQPCDIETATQAVAVPFLSGFVTGSVDSYMAAGITAIISDPDDVALHMARRSANFSDRGGPPIYLQTQTFLC